MDVSFLAAAALLIPALALRIQLQPADPARGVAVVYPPWTGAAEALARATAAGGALVRFGAADFIVVVRTEDPAAVARMLSGGAWLALDPQVLGLCASGELAS